ncbi:MAG: energy transducer TonB, partial [Edaphobacter sp.]|nr:energy transducer TonB [Edaphobacter sp.]
MRDQMEEFEMLLDDVLREVANPQPGTGLKQRVMMRLEMAAARASELHGIAEVRLLDGGTKQESILGSLWSGLRELVLPNRVSPLVLESSPVVVVDQMFEGRSYRSAGWAVVAHIFAVLMVGFAATTQIHFAAPVKMLTTELVVPPQAPPKADAMGGGGGQRGSTPVTKGAPPKFAEQQIFAPKAPPMIEPTIHIEPTLEVQQDLRMASSVPQVGVASSPIVGMSMGGGSGTGMGSGNGAGLGPGTGGNLGGGPRQVGGGVSAPVLLYHLDPEF